MAEDIWARKPTPNPKGEYGPGNWFDAFYDAKQLDVWLSELEELWYNTVSLERYNEMVERGDRYFGLIDSIVAGLQSYYGDVWKDEDFISSDYDACDAYYTVNWIAKQLRRLLKGKE